MTSPAHQSALHSGRRLDRGEVLRATLLGITDPKSLQALQERAVRRCLHPEGTAGEIIFAELPTHVTVGRSGSRADLGPEFAGALGKRIPVAWQKRGGGTWLHTPGQLVAAIVVPLARRRVGVADYLGRLQTAMIRVCDDIGFPVERREEPGVWSPRGQLGMIGVAIRRGVAYHGIALNVNPQMTHFGQVRANDLGVPVVSLASQLSCRATMQGVRERMLHHLAQSLGYKAVTAHAGHPLLARTTSSRALDHDA